MKRIRFIHWKPEEAGEYVKMLKSTGFKVEFEPYSNQVLTDDRGHPPDVIVIDLDRIPSQGRDLGIAYRTYKDTRHCPLVFVGGDPGKVRRISEILPDAHYTSWLEIAGALNRAISEPLIDPVVPESRMQGYAGTPLPKKLGIKANSVIALINAPDEIENLLSDLPAGAQLRKSGRGKSDLTLWFVTRRAELDRRVGNMVSRSRNGGLWIIWPKQSSGVNSDLTQNVVRRTGLEAGMVDFKVARIDDTWSGLRFSLRKEV